jgi:hypothetical protein
MIRNLNQYDHAYEKNFILEINSILINNFQ